MTLAASPAPHGAGDADPGHVSLREVTKTFATRDGSVPALAPIDLDLRPGEFVSIVGPSGCGKSTLMRIVCGLTDATTGRVMMGDDELDRPHAGIGVVFQSPTLLPWFTVEQNILMPRTLRGRVRPEDRKRASELISVAGLDGFEGKYPHQLSGGMRQRVGICRALIEEPSFLAMDEPFGALDALTREAMSLTLLEIWQNTGATVLFITHSIPEAVLLSDRVVVMSHRPGRVDEIVDVPLPRPRSLSDLGEEAFVDCTARIRGTLGAGDLH